MFSLTFDPGSVCFQCLKHDAAVFFHLQQPHTLQLSAVQVWDTALLGPSSLYGFAPGPDATQAADSGAAAAAARG